MQTGRDMQTGCIRMVWLGTVFSFSLIILLTYSNLYHMISPFKVCNSGLPGGSVVKTLYSKCRGNRFNPWSGIKIMAQLKNFQVCNSVVFSIVTESCNHHSRFRTSTASPRNSILAIDQPPKPLKPLIWFPPLWII